MSSGPRLPAIKAAIFECLQRGPRTGAQIMAYVWQLHPQDAPDLKCLHVDISQMRRMLAGKYRILCGRGSQGPHPYRLERY